MLVLPSLTVRVWWFIPPQVVELLLQNCISIYQNGDWSFCPFFPPIYSHIDGRFDNSSPVKLSLVSFCTWDTPVSLSFLSSQSHSIIHHFLFGVPHLWLPLNTIKIFWIWGNFSSLFIVLMYGLDEAFHGLAIKLLDFSIWILSDTSL